MLRGKLVRWALVAVVCAVALGWTSAVAQVAPWRIAQGSDGTLYLLTGDTRFTVSPDPISDEELAAMNDGGQLGGQLPMPPVSPVPPAQVVEVVVTATLIPPTSTPAPVATNTSVPAPAVVPEQPTTISGSGDVASRPFTLRGGNYTVSWTFTATGRSCFAAGASLLGVNGGLTSLGGRSVDLSSGQSSSGETQAYNLRAGQFYVKAYASCDWTVTVKPQ
jgi:hypothetical protein